MHTGEHPTPPPQHLAIVTDADGDDLTQHHYLVSGDSPQAMVLKVVAAEYGAEFLDELRASHRDPEALIERLGGAYIFHEQMAVTLVALSSLKTL